MRLRVLQLPVWGTSMSSSWLVFLLHCIFMFEDRTCNLNQKSWVETFTRLVRGSSTPSMLFCCCRPVDRILIPQCFSKSVRMPADEQIHSNKFSLCSMSEKMCSLQVLLPPEWAYTNRVGVKNTTWVGCVCVSGDEVVWRGIREPTRGISQKQGNTSALSAQYPAMEVEIAIVIAETLIARLGVFCRGRGWVA